MRKIQDPARCRELLLENRQRFGKVEKNAIVMAGAFDDAVREGRLYARRYAHGIALFLDEGAYYNLFYYWESGAPLDDFRREKPVLLEELGDGGARRDRFDRVEPGLSAAGFRRFKTNCQVEMDLRTVPEEKMRAWREAAMARLEEQALRIHFSGGDEYSMQAHALWKRYLDATDIPADHMENRPEDRLLCVLNQENAVAAVNWWRTVGKTSEGRHTVTSPAYYRKGLASAMLAVWCEEAQRRGAHRAFTWISDKNDKSLALYKKAGFSANGRVSRQYILQTKEN